jgi:hypothetical protein
MDMNHLMFPDESFDVVRSQASLHHFILVDEQQGLDLVYQEINRILKPDGLFFIHTKAEDGARRSGVQIIDTTEGLGWRVYQHANEKILLELLARNGFEPVTSVLQWKDWRGDNNVIVTARKARSVKTAYDIVCEPLRELRVTTDDEYYRWVHFILNKHKLRDMRYVEKSGKQYAVGLLQNAKGVFNIYVKPGIDGSKQDLFEEPCYQGFVNVNSLACKAMPEMQCVINSTRALRYPWVEEFVREWISEAGFIDSFIENNSQDESTMSRTEVYRDNDGDSGTPNKLIGTTKSGDAILPPTDVAQVAIAAHVPRSPKTSSSGLVDSMIKEMEDPVARSTAISGSNAPTVTPIHKLSPVLMTAIKSAA